MGTMEERNSKWSQNHWPPLSRNKAVGKDDESDCTSTKNMTMERTTSGKLVWCVTFALTAGFVQRKYYKVTVRQMLLFFVLSRQLGINLRVRAVDIPYEASNGRS